MREFINRYGVIVISVCLVIAAIIYFVFGRSGRKLGNPSLAYYVNDITGDESVQSSSAVPPLMDKDGQPNLVFEVKVSCDNGKNPHVAYLRKYTAQAQATIKELQALNDPSKDDQLQRVETEGELIRLPAKGSPWVKAISDDGDKVRETVQSMCKPGQTAMAVSPP